MPQVNEPSAVVIFRDGEQIKMRFEGQAGVTVALSPQEALAIGRKLLDMVGGSHVVISPSDLSSILDP